MVTLRCVAAVLLLTAVGCKDKEQKSQANSVRLTPSQGDLPTLLTRELATAKERNLKPFIELRAEWCGPCKQLEGSMGDARMKDAFAGTYLISVDIDEWGDALEPLGFETGSIPVFYELNAQGKPTGRSINGGAWEENIPQNMAPPLKAFFSGGG